jgi:hypothetical protein
MATRQGTVTLLEGGGFVAVWTGITEADKGSVVSLPAGVYDVTMHVVGDFVTAGAISLYGGNDSSTDTNYAVLNEGASTAIVATAASKVWKVDNPPRYIQPRATAGTSVSMDVYIFGHVNV